MTVRELVAMLLTMNQNLEVRFEDTYGLEMHYGDHEDVSRPICYVVEREGTVQLWDDDPAVQE